MIIWLLPEVVQREEYKEISRTQMARDVGIARWNFTKLALYQPERIDLDIVNRVCRVLDVTPLDLLAYIEDDDPDLETKAVDILTKNNMTPEEAHRFVRTKIGAESGSIPEKN